MSLFAPVEKRSSGGTDGLAAILAQAGLGRGRSSAGPIVNPDTAMRLGTVWACVNLLAELVAVTIDYHSVSTGPDGVSKRRPTDPLIYTNPSPIPNISANSWRRQIVYSWLLRGNSWGLVSSRDERGRATQIEIINPDFVTYWRDGLMGPFTYRVLGQEVDLYPNGPLWHKPLYVTPGYPIGMSPIEYGANAMGLGLAAEKFGSDWFADGATPSSVLSSDQVIDGTVAQGIKDRFIEAVRGKREPAVLGAGLSYQQISVAANESQFLDTIKATRTTVAQFFGMQVAPELVGAESSGSMTYSNTEQQNLNVLTYPANPLIERMVEIYTELTPAPQSSAPELSALLRVDAKTRSEIETQRVRAGTASPNQIKQENNEEPVPGGDRLNWPPYAVAFDHSSASGEGDDDHPLMPEAPPPPPPADHPAAFGPPDPAHADPSNGDT